jgi:uncharacterized protein
MISHALAFLLIMVLPIWDRFETSRLKTSSNPRAKIQSYQMTVGWLWICAAISLAAFGWQTLGVIHVSAADAHWLPSGSGALALGAGVAAAFLIGSLTPAFMAKHSPKVREGFEKQLAAFSFFLPRTGEERAWFALVSVSAGACEEILFRGFLIHYFRNAPFSLSVSAALLLSCVFFGTAHLYQGIAGVIQTAILGFAFGFLFLVTGNLILPIFLHAATDLRLLLILPKDAAVQG